MSLSLPTQAGHGRHVQSCAELGAEQQRDPSEDLPKQNTVLTAANSHLTWAAWRSATAASEMAAGLISKPVHHRSQGSATRRETCCCWSYRVTTTLIRKAGLSTTNCFVSPDVSPEGCKSWRRPQVGTCSVGTYSWAEWCRHLCHRPGWQSSRRGTARATAPSLSPATLTWAMLAQGRVCWEINQKLTHLLRGESSSKRVKLIVLVVR